jgi:hypothetical protein
MHDSFLHTALDTALSQALLLIRLGVMPHSLRRVGIERHAGAADSPPGSNPSD